MKKIFILPILALFLVLSISYVSACQGDKDCFKFGKDVTLIKGRIYNPDTNASVANATVSVTCVHQTKIIKLIKHHQNVTYTYKNITKNTTSGSDGSYLVTFKDDKECESKDIVYVTASKDDVSATEHGKVSDLKWWRCDIDLAKIDVPLVPEFGLFVGALTLFSAVGLFFIVRRY